MSIENISLSGKKVQVSNKKMTFLERIIQTSCNGRISRKNTYL